MYRIWKKYTFTFTFPFSPSTSSVSSMGREWTRERAMKTWERYISALGRVWKISAHVHVHALGWVWKIICACAYVFEAHITLTTVNSWLCLSLFGDSLRWLASKEVLNVMSVTRSHNKRLWLSPVKIPSEVTVNWSDKKWKWIEVVVLRQSLSKIIQQNGSHQSEHHGAARILRSYWRANVRCAYIAFSHCSAF